MTSNIPNGTTHYSFFQNDIDYFKKDLVKGSWFIYDKGWIRVDMTSFFKYQKIIEI
jgi:hypothetical protein